MDWLDRLFDRYRRWMGNIYLHKALQTMPPGSREQIAMIAAYDAYWRALDLRDRCELSDDDILNMVRSNHKDARKDLSNAERRK